LETLSKLIPEKKDRIEAYKIAKKIAYADSKLTKEEDDLLCKIMEVLELSPDDIG